MGDDRQKLYRYYERLGAALIRCMEQLKNDSDGGICAYYHAVEEIEGLLQVCASCEQSEEIIEDPLCGMHEDVDNRDTAALSDVMENKVYPIVKAWLERAQEKR